VADVADHLSASPRQVQRAFAEVGSTLREALTVVRARRAAQLLKEPTARVAEIAAAVGYHQPANFAKAFRRVHGVSPARYRADYMRQQARRRWADWYERQRVCEAAEQQRIEEWAEAVVADAANDRRDAFPDAARPV
jgi:Helix-turn-helix domain